MLGVVGDSNGFWDSRAFLTNVVSSAATAAFGIPFALIFFQALTAEQAQLIQERRVTHNTRQISSQLIDWSSELWPTGSESLAKLHSKAVECNRIWLEYNASQGLQPLPPVLYEAFSELVVDWLPYQERMQAIADVRLGLVGQDSYIQSTLREDFTRAGFDWVTPGLNHKYSARLADVGAKLSHLPTNVTLAGIVTLPDAAHFFSGQFAIAPYWNLATPIAEFASAILSYWDVVNELTVELNQNAKVN